MTQLQEFEQSLKRSNLSGNTITSYMWTVTWYQEHYDGITAGNLMAYKGYLVEHYRPKTVNLRIQGINKFLCFIGQEKLLRTPLSKITSTGEIEQRFRLN